MNGGGARLKTRRAGNGGLRGPCKIGWNRKEDGMEEGGREVGREREIGMCGRRD